MTRSLLAILAITLVSASSAFASPTPSLFGAWRIVRIAGYGEVSSGEAPARRALGRNVTITPDAIILPDDPCTGHRLTRSTVQVTDFLRQSWQVARSDLRLSPYRLGATAEHVDAVCADALVLDRDTLLVSSGEGAFFIVRKK